jgi:actin-related protein 2
MMFYVPTFIKVGYAGSNCPAHGEWVRTRFFSVSFTDEKFIAVFPSVIGRPIWHAEERIGDAVIKDIMVGDEAAALRNYLQVTRRWNMASFATGRI